MIFCPLLVMQHTEKVGDAKDSEHRVETDPETRGTIPRLFIPTEHKPYEKIVRLREEQVRFRQPESAGQPHLSHPHHHQQNRQHQHQYHQETFCQPRFQGNPSFSSLA